MSGPLVGVLALQGDVREHDRALCASGAEPRAVRRPEDLEGLDGLVLPGGESTTMTRLLELFDLLQPLRDAVAGGLPTYGSCAGLILLADHVLDERSGARGPGGVGGLDVVVRRNAFGRQVDSFETDLELTGVGRMHAVFIRAPWVERVGAGATVLATVPGVPGGSRTGHVEGAPPQAGTSGEVPESRVVAVRQGSVLATSFHPELTGDARVHGLFVAMVKEAGG